jgi:periplasmic protein TonB
MGVASRPVGRGELGSLQGCLVGGDPEQREREWRVRRKSLILSITLQVLVVAAIVVIPLFGKPALMASTVVVPVPPYYAHAERRPADPAKPNSPRPQTASRFWERFAIPDKIVMHTQPVDDGPPEPPGFADSPTGRSGIGEIPLIDTRAHPEQPQETTVQPPKKIRVTQIDPAMLKVRVEPIYPTLMRQIHKSGQVQLHAIIGTDGTIQALQAVGGDPGFYQSAMDAVRQWRYKPTILNGVAVEVDTFITVIYNIGG